MNGNICGKEELNILLRKKTKINHSDLFYEH